MNQKYCIKCLKSNTDIYLMLLPGLLLLIIFKYIPMGGLIIAFQNYNIFSGVSASEWVGVDNFVNLFNDSEFYKVFLNTVLISIYRLLVTFPVTILIAVILNEIRLMTFKRVMQTILYLPHFLSWVIASGLFISILSPTSGMVNSIIVFFGGESIPFMMSNDWFRSVIVLSDTWKTAGWGAIIFIAAIAGIDQELYEAAKVDGAGRIRQIFHITLPGITSTIVVMLVLKLGHIMRDGTDQVLMMYNPVVYDTGDIIGTFVFRRGIGRMDYSFSTAVGLFESVIGLFLLVSGNSLSRNLVGKSIW